MDIKGAPVPNEQVFIKAEDISYTNATTTDQHGLAKFSIDTTGISGYSLTIKVSQKWAGHRIQGEALQQWELNKV